MTREITEAEQRAELHRLIATGEARRIRESAGLSFSVIARSIGKTDPSVVNRWEQGSRRPQGAAALEYLKLLKRLKTISEAS